MINIFIADDHQVVREGIVAILSKERDMNVIGEATDGSEAIEKILKLQPDIVIMDISMPHTNGLEAVKQLFKLEFKGKIIILTQHEKEEYVRIAMQYGVSGYLVKISIKQEVIDAVRAVASNDVYFSPSVSRVLVEELRLKGRRKKNERTGLELTNREMQVLQLIAEGNSSKMIAEKMFISLRTVEFHRTNIIQKLGIHDIAGLTRYAIKLGLVKA